MNYIKHLNGVFQKFWEDSRLNSTHISLYMALFQVWNLSRFPELFYIDRQEIMKLSKVGSKATYHRCIKQLEDWNYLNYFPSHNPYKGSQIKMLNFDTTSETSVDATTDTSSEQDVVQALVPNTNNNKQIENSIKTKLPQNELEVIDFFKNKKWPDTEAMKFYNHYQAIGWKLGGKAKIVDWHATASNWMLKANELETFTEPSQNKDNLRTTKLKDYGQPL